VPPAAGAACDVDGSGRGASLSSSPCSSGGGRGLPRFRRGAERPGGPAFPPGWASLTASALGAYGLNCRNCRASVSASALDEMAACLLPS
jgi:hypothetical protein